MADPAVQRTADRETIRQIMREHKVFRYRSRMRSILGDEGFAFDADAEDSLLNDLAAVLVPADRPETEPAPEFVDPKPYVDSWGRRLTLKGLTFSPRSRVEYDAQNGTAK